MVLGDPVKDPQRGLDPQVENHYWQTSNVMFLPKLAFLYANSTPKVAETFLNSSHKCC